MNILLFFLKIIYLFLKSIMKFFKFIIILFNSFIINLLIKHPIKFFQQNQKLKLILEEWQ